MSVAKTMNHPDRHPLVLGQLGHERRQQRFEVRKRHRSINRGEEVPTLQSDLVHGSAPGNPIEVSDGIGHGPEPIPVVPSPCQRVGGRLTSEIRTERTDQCHPKPRLGRHEEGVEVVLGVGIHYRPKGFRMPSG